MEDVAYDHTNTPVDFDWEKMLPICLGSDMAPSTIHTRFSTPHHCTRIAPQPEPNPMTGSVHVRSLSRGESGCHRERDRLFWLSVVRHLLYGDRKSVV